MPAPDTRQSIFDPGMDVATVVFSHVQCVKTRVNLSLVSKLWRDASKPAAAYPLEVRLRRVLAHTFIPNGLVSFYHIHIHDGQRRSPVSTLRESRWTSWELEELARLNVCNYAALQGSVRLLKWDASERPYLECKHVRLRSHKWTLARSPVLARERVPLVVRHVLLRRPIQTLGLSAVRGG